MSEWIPIIGEVVGCAMVAAIVAVVLHFRLEETRMRVEAEIRQMDMAYQHARESQRQ